MPWLMMYGVSSLMISHQDWFRSDQPERWQPLFEREYRRQVPDQADLRVLAQEILKDCNLEGAFWVQRSKPEEIHINRFKFRNEVRIIYSIKDQMLRAEEQHFKWNRVVLRMHFRGGFEQPTLFDALWAILVDVACLGILIWIGSGILMWWRLARLRLWGAIALSGGLLSFLLLIWRL